ncbi:MAG: superoxide dismutase [Eubacteriales bacterium]|nr:superoxide dismutase [Eubacteriales bacterium]
MSYKYTKLAYPYSALEPVIDAKTMEVHHDKHFKGYCEKYNKAVAETKFAELDVAEVLSRLDEVPSDKLTAIRNNGGGTYNHHLFWDCMQPGGAKEPSGELGQLIEAKFGSFSDFKEKFEAAGAGQFGSGWVWLVVKDGELEILSTPNQDCPISKGYTPLLGNDVWEHAYYLKYQNRRADYLKEWWKVVNWDVVAERLQAAK